MANCILSASSTHGMWALGSGNDALWSQRDSCQMCWVFNQVRVCMMVADFEKFSLFSPAGSRCHQHCFASRIWPISWGGGEGSDAPWWSRRNSSSLGLHTPRQKGWQANSAISTTPAISHHCWKTSRESGSLGTTSAGEGAVSLSGGTYQHGLCPVQSPFWAAQKPGLQKQAHQPLESNLRFLVCGEAGQQKQFSAGEGGARQGEFGTGRKLYCGAQHCDWQAARLLPAIRAIFPNSKC